MVGVILILLLVWAGLVVLLWAGSVWFQGYIYSEPAPQLVWSALRFRPLKEGEAPLRGGQ